ncbi:hypothetical protein VQ042_10350 [Aurantimonas sp. A2-1-M11]|uniref:hypothetical protein n=1 Tax=Aurantimonas sp. A2-1-M11 TaxID=3113712 RepID=UPI002F93914C
MTRIGTIILVSLAALTFAGGPVVARDGPGDRSQEVRRAAPVAEGLIHLAQADCSGAGAKAAAQTGGDVLSVSTRTENGQTVCVVTVLVPGTDGGRPRKTTVTIRP